MADYNKIFIDACCKNDFKKANLLIDIELVNINHKNINGNTPLMIFCANNNWNIVEFLVKKGSDITLSNVDGDTALIRAASHNKNYEKDDNEIVELLIGDIIDNQDNNGNTAILRACENKNEELVLLLHKKGADCFIKNISGFSAFDALLILSKTSTVFKSLHEKLSLEKFIDEDPSTILGL